jgi:hypothetical protein
MVRQAPELVRLYPILLTRWEVPGRVVEVNRAGCTLDSIPVERVGAPAGAGFGCGLIDHEVLQRGLRRIRIAGVPQLIQQKTLRRVSEGSSNWVQGLDLNQRPSGYEGNLIADDAQ